MPSSSLQNRHMLSFQSGSINGAVGMAGSVNFGNFACEIGGSVGNGASYFTEGPGVVNCNSGGNEAWQAGSSSSNSDFDTVARLKGKQQQQQDSGLTTEWTPEEHSILKRRLLQYSTENGITKYIKVAAMLPRKTVRDVAMRCQWLSKQESNKRRKLEDYYAGRRMKNMKMNIHMVNPSNITSLAPMMHQVNLNGRFSHEGPLLDGATQQLMDENIGMLHQISTNLATYKVQENLDLFCRTRNNFTTIFKNMSNTPGIMSQMPPLPVLANEQLLNAAILPSSNQAFMFGGPGVHLDQQQARHQRYYRMRET